VGGEWGGDLRIRLRWMGSAGWGWVGWGWGCEICWPVLEGGAGDGGGEVVDDWLVGEGGRIEWGWGKAAEVGGGGGLVGGIWKVGEGGWRPCSWVLVTWEDRWVGDA